MKKPVNMNDEVDEVNKYVEEKSINTKHVILSNNENKMSDKS